MNLNAKLECFRQSLARANGEVFHVPLPEISAEMARTTAKLRQAMGDISQGVKDERGIAVSVMAYLRTGNLASYRDAKYVCFGVETAYGQKQIRLIEHERFSALLQHLARYESEPRKFRRCFQGLFKAYLRYPGHRTEHPAGRRNWQMLRQYLAERVGAVVQHPPQMDWIEALARHRNLFEEKPCAPYGKPLLAGNTAQIDELKQKLGVNDDTWVMSEVILAQVDAAIGLEDGPFKSHIPRLVSLLSPLHQLLTQGLSQLVRRYAQCGERPEQPELRELALREWHSPWLERNKPLWHAQVGELATGMMSLWLKQRSIRDFFELLQADGAADRQRMEFWLKYAESMDEIWLALGSNSRYNPHKDYTRIRREMDGRWMELEGGNYQADNAFMMKIGGLLFIEFARQNNACHVFDAQDMPFRLGQRSVLATKEGLKNSNHRGHRGTWRHTEGWQWGFEGGLKRHAGAYPAELKTQGRAPQPFAIVTQTADGRLPHEALANTRPGHFDALELTLLRNTCAAHGVQVEDRRPAGALLVRADKHNAILSAILEQKGFRYNEAKGVWWHEED